MPQLANFSASERKDKVLARGMNAYHDKIKTRNRKGSTLNLSSCGGYKPGLWVQAAALHPRTRSTGSTPKLAVPHRVSAGRFPPLMRHVSGALYCRKHIFHCCERDVEFSIAKTTVFLRLSSAYGRIRPELVHAV